MTYRCGACRRTGVGLHEGMLEPELPDVRLRLLLCAACGAARAYVAGLDPWRGPELETVALRPEDREAAERDALVELALELLAPAPEAPGDERGLLPLPVARPAPPRDC